MTAIAAAEPPTSAAPAALEDILVIAPTPLPGAPIDLNKVPGNVQTLGAADLRRDGTANFTDALNSHLGSVNINDALADPFQPDILFRGFEASPVLGTPEGLAVYQNGVRVNEAFGDAVNWDLIPDLAINKVQLLSSSPLFGLNALGGVVTVTMKNGFTYHGAEAEASGGSFDRRTGSAEWGANDGHLGVYAAARVLDQSGWRLFAQDSVHQYYLALSLRSDQTAIDLSYARADNRLFGQGAAPVQSLALNPQNVFTGPQNNVNRLDFVTLNLAHDVSDKSSLQGVVYLRHYQQTVANGNTTNYSLCEHGGEAGELCQSDGSTAVLGANGAPLASPTLASATALGENNYEAINAMGLGASLQYIRTATLLGHGNYFAAGASADAADIDFESGTQVGAISGSLLVEPSSLIVSTPETSDFAATPVSLKGRNRYYGFYVTDAFDVTPRLTVTGSGRFNIAEILLSDQIGTNLSGTNRYTHLDPALGATYQWTRRVSAFVGYSINNRTPTISEIECSDPAHPCLLPSNLAGDPPNLRQVIAHTLEMGLRGTWLDAGASGRLAWNASVFRSDLEDDIYGIATTFSTGFFQNIGATRRQGVESGLRWEATRWSTYLQYSYIDATFRSPLALSSPANPHQDAAGNIEVAPGDQLPGIPHHRIKAGLDVAVAPRVLVGATVVMVTSQYYRGDESNQNAPLPGYAVVGAHLSWKPSDHVEIYASLQNALNKYYSTFGVYSDPTGVGAPGIPPNATSNGPGVDNRFQSPAAPRAAFAGVKVGI